MTTTHRTRPAASPAYYLGRPARCGGPPCDVDPAGRAPGPDQPTTDHGDRMVASHAGAMR